MNLVIILPLILPLLMATFSLLPRQWRLNRELFAIVGSAGHLAASCYMFISVYKSGIIVVNVGSWVPPFGIVLVYDLFSCVMLVMVGIMAFVVSLYSVASVDPLRNAFGYFPVFHILIMGCSGAFVAGDIFNLYVWFEMILISSFVLLTLGGERHQILGGVKYVVINLVASSFFLIGIGLIYAQMGTLNMADLALKYRAQGLGGARGVTAVFFFITFAIKAGVFPFFFWLPDSYYTPPIAVAAIFSGLLTKVGVYALLRFFTLIFVPHTELVSHLFLWLAGLTMITGVLGAWSETDIRKILSFHIISQIGYMLLGLAFYTPLAIGGAIYFMLHNILAKSNLFLISGVVGQLGGSFQVKKLGGLYNSFFLLSILFLIPALSLAGVPPLSGFFGKLSLIKEGLHAGEYLIVFVALSVSLITTLSMLKIWHYCFWQPAPAGHPEPQTINNLGDSGYLLILPSVILAGLTLALGFFAEFFLNVTLKIAEQLMHPEIYINKVLQL